MSASHSVAAWKARTGSVRRLWASSLHFVRYRPTGAFGLAVIALVVAAAVFAPYVTTREPLVMNVVDRFQGPSLSHFMGTDNFGRDVFSNVVYGARISLFVGITAVAFGTGIAALWGVVSGYVGGTFDLLTQRLVDIVQGLPTLVLALVLVAALGASVFNTILAISISLMPLGVRVVRGSTLTTKSNAYIEAARAIGASPSRVMFRHVLPQTLAPYLIVVSTTLGTAILIEASLSFLGAGVPPPEPSWGRMLGGTGRDMMLRAPWLTIFPGLAITLTVLAFNLFGDALRDIWDPRLRGTLGARMNGR